MTDPGRSMITDVDDYFAMGCGRCDRFRSADCSSQIWSGGLARLRAICLASGLVETAKWGHPCYVEAGQNVAILGAFRAHFRLSFFNAGLMKDPHGILEKQGPNTAHADCLNFRSVADVDAKADIIRDYLAEAKAYAAAGIKPAKTGTHLMLPEELVKALEADPDLAAAFAALTLGRQKSYVVALSGAKKPQTRIDRIAKFKTKIIAGKGAQER